MGSDHLVRLHIAKSKERRQYSWKGDSDHDVQVAKWTLLCKERRQDSLSVPCTLYKMQKAKKEDKTHCEDDSATPRASPCHHTALHKASSCYTLFIRRIGFCCDKGSLRIFGQYFPIHSPGSRMHIGNKYDPCGSCHSISRKPYLECDVQGVFLHWASP